MRRDKGWNDPKCVKEGKKLHSKITKTILSHKFSDDVATPLKANMLLNCTVAALYDVIWELKKSGLKTDEEIARWAKDIAKHIKCV